MREVFFTFIHLKTIIKGKYLKIDSHLNLSMCGIAFCVYQFLRFDRTFRFTDISLQKHLPSGMLLPWDLLPLEIQSNESFCVEISQY